MADFIVNQSTDNGVGDTETNVNTTMNGVRMNQNSDATFAMIAASPPQIFINEVDVDTPSSDVIEFVELYDGGTGNTSLDGLVVVFFNGSNDLSYAAFDLDGFSTDANGFFVLGNAGTSNVDLVFADNSLQNGADAIALYQGDAADFPTSSALTTTNLIDAIVYDTDDADDSGLLTGLEQSTQFNENVNGNKDAESNSRVPDGTGVFTTQVSTPGAANTLQNSAPTTENSTVNLDEDIIHAFNIGDFIFNDADANDALQSIQVTQLPTAGQLFVDANTNNALDTNEAVSLNQELTLSDINQLKFAPAANANGLSYDSFQFQVSDGADFSTDATMTLDVSLVNDAPILSGDATFDAINEDSLDIANIGKTVADLVSELITDVDFDPKGIAITGVDNANGVWQYSTDGGNTWQALDNAASDSNAVTLGATSLYTSTLGTAPNSQSWLSFTNLNLAPPFSPATATTDTGGTLLDTTAAQSIYAGYSNYISQSLVNPDFPKLDNTLGYQISFQMQLLEESRSNENRAGFSIVAVSQDATKAIEIGFQKVSDTEGNIFAQGGPTFTSAENVSFNTNEATHYVLAVEGDNYTLLADGVQILTGALRDYTSFEGAIDPYETPNFIFLGDDTTSAQGSFLLSQVAVETETRIRFAPDANYNGDASIQFRAWDATDGSANGEASVDASTNGDAAAFSATDSTATITVNSVNDQPSFTASDPAAVEAGSGETTLNNWAAFDPGGGETGQTATYLVSEISNSALFAATPSIDANGNLTYNPAAGVAGSSTFQVQVQDNGGTDNGGVDTSEGQTFTITVQDTTAPDAIAQDITVDLDASGNASITAAQVDDGSSDNVGIASLSLDQTAFTSDDLGANTVTLTVTDTSGNASSDTAIVTVQQNTGLVAVTAASDAAEPDANGLFTVSLSNPSETDTVLSYSISGDAAPDVDYVALSGEVTILAGATTADIDVSVLDDAIAEAPETITLTLNTIANESSAISLDEGNRTATITLLDDGDITPNKGLFNFEQYVLQEALEEERVVPFTPVTFDGVYIPNLFDEPFYLANNPDVKAAVEQGDLTSGYDHFVQFGWLEGRSPSTLFDEAFYRADNPDVNAAVAEGVFSSGFQHYLLYGQVENRRPSELFDPNDYLLNNSDVRNAVNQDLLVSGFQHFVNHGLAEGRSPDLLLFNENDYLQQYEDVSLAVANQAFESGYQHYLLFGQQEGRNPSGLFNEASYRSLNPDVDMAVDNGAFASGFEHYLEFGRAEGRPV